MGAGEREKKNICNASTNSKFYHVWLGDLADG